MDHKEIGCYVNRIDLALVNTAMNLLVA